MLFTLPQVFHVNASGTPYAGAKLYFYAAGTTTHQPVYSDIDLTTEHAQPVQADGYGRFPAIYLNSNAAGDYRIQLYTSGNVLIYDQDDVPKSDLTQVSVGGALWPRTAAEQSAGVTPTNYYYEQGDVRRYGAALDGLTDDTTAVSNALKVGYSAGCAVVFPNDSTCITGNIVIKAANLNVPQAVLGRGVTLKALAASSGVFITIENPHTTNPGFTFDLGGGTINANSLCSTALKVHGMQGCVLRNFDAINSTGSGVWLSGESGYGIYYNVIENVRAGKNGSPNAGAGWTIKSIGSGNYIASNAFIGLKSQWNTTYGFDIDWCSGTYIGCEAERNGDAGFNINNTYSSDFLGGYSEHNNDDVADTSFTLTSNSTGVKIFGGRHIGAITGTTTGLGNAFFPTNKSWSLNYNEDGKLTVSALTVRTGGGIAMGGATAIEDSINCATPWELYASGTTCLVLASDHVRSELPFGVQSTSARLYAGTGSPQGVVTAVAGSLYLRTDGGASTTLYVKESGSGNTGWTAK